MSINWLKLNHFHENHIRLHERFSIWLSTIVAAIQFNTQTGQKRFETEIIEERKVNRVSSLSAPFVYIHHFVDEIFFEIVIWGVFEICQCDNHFISFHFVFEAIFICLCRLYSISVFVYSYGSTYLSTHIIHIWLRRTLLIAFVASNFKQLN